MRVTSTTHARARARTTTGATTNAGTTTGRTGTARARLRVGSAIATALLLTLAGCTLGGGDDGGDDDTGTGGSTNGTDAPTGDGAATDGATSDRAGGEVALVAHDSFTLPEELIEQFEADTGYTLLVTTPGDAGGVVNELLLTAGSPSADVVYGIDNAYATRAIAGGILQPYVPDSLPASAEDLRVEDELLTPIDFGDVCLNIDTTWFEDDGRPAPESLEDLASEQYADLTVVTDPNVSSPGMALLLATVAEYGEDGFEQYWQRLLDNGLRVVDSWSDAYYVDFTASGGDRPIVLSYSSSPAATVTEDGESSTTAALLETCVRQVEYAGVVAGAENPDGARAVIDWLLSEDVQAALPDSIYMYPVSDAVELPEEWAQFAPVAEDPLQVPAEDIDANREDWLGRWDAVVGG